MAVAPEVIVIRPVLSVSGANANLKTAVCLGFGRYQRNHSQRCHPQKEISSHIFSYDLFSRIRRMELLFMRLLGLG